MSRKTKRIFGDLEGMSLTLGALTEFCNDGDCRQCRETLAGINHQSARDALAVLDANPDPDGRRRKIREFGDFLMRAMMSVILSQ